ncbi:glycoside hydrolase family 57 protein [Sulfurimonas sp. HSL-1716]|uniref:glycoside hydrolase family 57 protein n=1 Tax=Hydrocurvibacter sulfurireducens TaxID=3131937 RepID=UPI0031F9EE2F
MKLSFMWHMHQPDYRDATGIMQMPWVFLHAIKDYYDMPWMLSKHSGVKATFNITPPLMQQLKLYYDKPQENDKFLELWLKNPSYLDEDDRNWVIKICKSSNYETMVVPFERYKELYIQEHFNNDELIELEILFMLSWCGIYLQENSDLVKRLIKKQKDYDLEEKFLLLNELSIFISGIFDYYLKLKKEGVIMISTTPLNHPILPLLMDMGNARIANPATNMPKEYINLEEDALMQVKKAQELFYDTFGFMPEGFWPAEGAVDEKSIELLRFCGVKWIATDEEILFKSLNSNNRADIYFPYSYNDVCIGFRDHNLSDLIGFTYRHSDSYEASSNFISELQKIRDVNPDAVVFVILDGENAWEFFKKNGFNFFNSLYEKLKNLPWCETITMEEICGLSLKKLSRLAPGSWIHGEFNTWVGHREKTRAWELLYLTKRDYEHHKESLDKEVIEKINEHFLIAECSDWFWWYGDDHYSEFGEEFDELFRSHLINIYNLINITPPSDLFIPVIKNKSAQSFWLKPQSDISPVINGKHDSFFEWIGCGVVDESKIFSTMDKQRGPIKRILYGQDDEKLYFAFEAKMKELCGSDLIEIIIDPINVRGKVGFETQKVFLDGLEVNVACKDQLEISIDKSKMKNGEIHIRFELEKEGSVIQTLPGFGELKIDVGNDYSHNWFV